MQSGTRNVWDGGMSRVSRLTRAGKIYEPYLCTNAGNWAC